MRFKLFKANFEAFGFVLSATKLLIGYDGNMGRKIIGKTKIKKTIKKTIKIDKRATKKRKGETLSRPKGIRFSNDGKTMTFEMDERFNANLRRSFRQLSKGKESDREFGASFDFEFKDNDSRNELILQDVDISRGRTRTENPDNRASVKIRAQNDDEFYIHNHPPRGDLSDNWNRPSGADVGILIWQKQEARGFIVEAAYIQQPDGRLIRYSIIDENKAIDAYLEADEQFQNLNEFEQAEWNGSVDWKIESEVQKIRKEVTRKAELLESHPKNRSAQDKSTDKFLKRDTRLGELVVKEDMREIKKDSDGGFNQEDFEKRFDKVAKLEQQRDDLFAEFESEESRINKKYPPIPSKLFVIRKDNEN